MVRAIAGVVYPKRSGRTLEGDVFDRELPRVVVYARKRKRKPKGWARHSGRLSKRQR